MLEVAYERSVRRIAAEVGERPRGSLYLAVGKSAEVRTAVETALGERGVAVERVRLAEDEGPWARVVAAREQNGRAADEVLLSVAGLGEMPEDKLDRILAQLNLGRELRVTHRLHVLLWVGKLDGLERFRTGAPDLWGHRSGVELFLSSEDFEIAFEELGLGEVPKSLETLLHETEEELATNLRPARRITLLTLNALRLALSGRREEAFRALEGAETLFLEQPLGPREAALTHAHIVRRKLELWEIVGRSKEAFEYATHLNQAPDQAPELRAILGEKTARYHRAAGRTTESLTCLAESLRINEEHPRSQMLAGTLLERATVFLSVGALDAAIRDVRAASEEFDKHGTRDNTSEAEWSLVRAEGDTILAQVSFTRADLLRSIRHAHRNLALRVALSEKLGIRPALASIADTYRKLGLLGDARRFARHAIALSEQSPWEVAWWTRWLGGRDADELDHRSAIARHESASIFYRVAAALEQMPHLRTSRLLTASQVLYQSLAPLKDAKRHLQEAEQLLNRAVATSAANSLEQYALIQQNRAALARAAKRWRRAEAEYITLLAWAETNWGPYKRAEVLLDLARVARRRKKLNHAAAYAERAQREVAIDPPEYRNRFTAIAAAREIARIRKAMGDLPAAHTALASALTVAQGDGLRLRERDVLLDLAELPPAPGSSDQRLEHAQRARGIAQDAAFPVDEAEAMLVLAELHLDAGQVRRARALFEQAVWIVDRIGPAAVRARAARVRSKLDG